MKPEAETISPEAQANLAAIMSSSTYLLAERDAGFLGLPESRSIRMQLELQKTEHYLTQARIESTIVVFGGTQVVSGPEAARKLAAAQAALKANPQDGTLAREVERAEAAARKSRYYDEAREFAKLVSGACQIDGRCRFVMATGGGPGLMEAANRGAFDVGAKSIGFNIVLPHEQHPNPYITPDLCFQFHYFAMRKFHFVLRAAALVVFPGGFGTLDELFNTLCLRQTNCMRPIPIILYGREFWDGVIDFQRLADEGVIADEHLELFTYADKPEEAWRLIREFHGIDLA